MHIAGSTVLVTGSASGLGLATVRKLHGQGARVVILDLPSSQGDAVAKEFGDGVIFCPGDVTSADDVARAGPAAGELGRLRVAVNCAGIGNAVRTVGKNGPFPLDAFTRVVTINLIGTFNVIRLAAERISQANEVGGSAASSLTPRRSRRTMARSGRPRTPRPRAESSA